MKILHSADWHLGKSLFGRRRDAEFEQFLAWLLQVINREKIDVLLVAGDIFDNPTPSVRVQTMYYDFLAQVARSHCRHVVVIGGNHDSANFLEAPQALLSVLNVHVVGQVTNSPADEVLLLKDADGVPELLVAAVPFLRDKDVRQISEDESVADKESNLLAGIRAHYATVGAATIEQSKANKGIPIIGMGHLFTAGGRTIMDDGVRDLYVGSLAYVTPSIFPSEWCYVALGHLHIAQTVGGCETVRYSGSPIPMGFGEAAQQKSVCIVNLTESVTVRLLEVPVFQRLERIQGDLPIIEAKLSEWIAIGDSVWVEVIYTGTKIVTDLREHIEKIIKGSEVEVLRLKNRIANNHALMAIEQAETLQDLSLNDVFERFLMTKVVPETQWQDLKQIYEEVLMEIQHSEVSNFVVQREVSA